MAVEEDRIQREGEREADRTQRNLAAAVEDARARSGLQRARQLRLQKMALRIQRAGLRQALCTWKDTAGEFRRHCNLVQKMALRIRNVCVYTAWVSMTQIVMTQDRARPWCPPSA